MFIRILIISAITFLTLKAASQSLTQTVRGTVTDKITNASLPGATVILLNLEPLTGVAADANGNFKLTHVPVGRQSLRIVFMGYKDRLINDIVVNSGKEVVLSVALEEDYIEGKEVEITAKIDKTKALNEMTTVSARTFSVEETQKFAAAVNDPGRMASSFAGVVSTEDGNNTISIRGNSPTGLQWRMEGITIPNPNHFALPGTSGGGISILSAQTLSNSDFLTGAFPAEYGNALSGVFDLKLRKGNNEKSENTFQAGFLGVDVAAEGPFNKNYAGSYLINYRYSTLSMLGKIGVEVGEGTTDFQDLSFNLSMPAKKAGLFTLFGFGGISSQKYEADKDSSLWSEDDESYNSKFDANTGAVGLTHSIILNDKVYLKTTLSASHNLTGFNADQLQSEYKPVRKHDEKSMETKYSASTVLNYKQNSRQSYRTGLVFTSTSYNIYQKLFDHDVNGLVTYIHSDGNMQSIQAFAQTNYHFTERLSGNAGLHYSQLMLNNSASIEPRASLKYEFSNKSVLGIGYGLHSQLQPTGVYFAQVNNTDGSVSYPNESLDMSKAHHFVLSYDYIINEYMHAKAETYYQSLFDIPVRSDIKNSYSLVNEIGGYIADPLVNKGTGSNYGIDLTLEQFLRNNFYFLLSGSIYESKYKGSDQVLHDTRFNGNYSLTFTGGKEIKTGSWLRNRILGLNIKTIYSGGLRDTPIDLQASIAEGSDETIYIEDKAYTEKNPDYFRTDIKISLKRNRLRSTHTIALDVQNVTNRKNIYRKYFDKESASIKTYYQTSLIPILSYKIDF